jgi:hypothetical protein
LKFCVETTGRKIRIEFNCALERHRLTSDRPLGCELDFSRSQPASFEAAGASMCGMTKSLDLLGGAERHATHPPGFAMAAERSSQVLLEQIQAVAVPQANR